MALQLDLTLLQHPSVLLLVALLSIYLIYSSYVSYRLEQTRGAIKAQHGCREPRPSPYWWDIYGFFNLYKMVMAARAHRLLEFWEQRFEKFGSTYSTQRRGIRMIATKDPENIKAVLVTKFDDWGVAPVREQFNLLLGQGIFTSDGAFWQHSRSLLRPQFDKAQISAVSHLEEHIQKLLLHIPKDGKTVELQELFHSFTMDTSCEFLTGVSTDLLNPVRNEEGHHFVKAFDNAMGDAMLRSRMGRLYYLFPHAKEDADIAYARQAINKWVEAAIEHKQKVAAGEKKKRDQSRYVFSEALAEDEAVDAERIRDEILNILLAGRDTTASLLSDLWFSLAREPEVFAKLQVEVDKLNGELPTYENLKNMPYLKHCAQETLRMYPPVPALGKIALRDTVLPRGGGSEGEDPMFVTKGSMMMYNFRSSMRQKSVYGADAAVFRPERWADPGLRPQFSFVPFNAGPRICLGQQYALTEAYYVTTRLMQEFRRIENRDPQPWQEKMTVTCCSLNGVQVGLYA